MNHLVHTGKRSMLIATAAIVVGCGADQQNPRHSSGVALQGGVPGTPVPVSGEFTFAMSPVSARDADGNTFAEFEFEEEISGSIEGTRTGTGTLRLHPDGTFTLADTGFVTSTAAGSFGSVNAEAWAEGTVESFAGSVTVYGETGTGAFAGLQGVIKIAGTATGPLTLAGTYVGQLHF